MEVEEEAPDLTSRFEDTKVAPWLLCMVILPIDVEVVES